MPKLETVAQTQIDNAMQLQDVLAPLALTRNQYAATHRAIASYLPAHVTLAQRTPKSVVTITIDKDGERYKMSVNNRARVSLPAMA